jgi:hypothetical protein
MHLEREPWSILRLLSGVGAGPAHWRAAYVYRWSVTECGSLRVSNAWGVGKRGA